MIVKNNYGRQIDCIHKGCKKECEGSFSYTPPFANAMDSVFIAFCSDHKEEAEQELNKGQSYTDRINQAGSNS